MKKRILTLLVVAVAGIVAISAQGRRGLKINEVMIANDSTTKRVNILFFIYV